MFQKIEYEHINNEYHLVDTNFTKIIKINDTNTTSYVNDIFTAIYQTYKFRPECPFNNIRLYIAQALYPFENYEWYIETCQFTQDNFEKMNRVLVSFRKKPINNQFDLLGTSNYIYNQTQNTFTISTTTTTTATTIPNFTFTYRGLNNGATGNNR